MNKAETKVDGVLFDKDGTIYDFHATWNVWAHGALNDLALGDVSRLERIAAAVRFDLEGKQFFPDSVAIAGTNREIALCIAPERPDLSVEEIDRFLSVSSSNAPLAPAVELGPFLSALRAMGLKLGVMTNDSEFGARSHLGASGVLDQFDFVAGADSGFGAKPDPSPLLAFAEVQGLDPARVVMVGDSTHDLLAGRAAGMQTVGVLTGVAGPAELAPFADTVMPDIGGLLDWIPVAR